MKITKRQLRRLIREAVSLSPEEIEQGLIDRAVGYHQDGALKSDPGAIKMLLQDDFMDDFGHEADIKDYEELIDQLSKDPDGGKGFTLPEAPSTHSLEHQRRRTFRRR